MSHTRRTKSEPIEGNYESLVKELNKFCKQLDTLRSKALRDYNEVRNSVQDNADRIQLEHIRSNSIKSFENFFKLKLDALKLLALIADKLTPKQNKEINEKLTKDDKDDMSKYLETLRKDFNNRKNK